MKNETVILPWDLAESFVTDVFEAIGVPRDEAAICADVLLESDRRGIESHGLNRFKPIYYDRVREGVQKATTEFEVVKKTMTTAVVDGHDGMGQVIGKKSMQMAIDMAKAYGMGMVSVRNSTHYGIAGYYATMATKAGLVGIVGTNARPSQAPTFGTENMMGTNPLTFGFPTDEDFPFLLDCATSIIQRGKIEYYARLGTPVPEGLVINADGEPMTDAEAILDALTAGQAALAPVGGSLPETGGYKGYGYAAAVEIMSAAFSAGSFLKALSGKKDGVNVPHRLGHFFIVIDPEGFVGLDSFRKTTGDILRSLRASRKAKGQERIYTAGEKEYYISLDRAGSGVPVTPDVQKELLDIRAELGLSGYRFPFE